MPKTIIVTGTPATGKTMFSKNLGHKYVDLTKVIKENELYESFDKKRDCLVVNEKKLRKYLVRMIKESKEKLVIDGHLSHYIPKSYVEKCYVMKCDISILKKRLEKRKYFKEKVNENIESEIVDVCLNEALEKGHNVEIVNTTH